MLYILFVLILIVAELAYFRIADRYNIIDKPNHRSSHQEITIRGGGVIFPLSVILWFPFFGFQYPLVVLGLVLITLISFVDDLKDISRSIRLLFHLIAVSLAFYSLNIFALDWYLVVLSYIMVVGIINAYNFMDGINGITGIYSLVLFATLGWINQYQVQFVNPGLIISLIIGVLIFNFFNFRKRAKCFAGDVGSVSLAFVVVFLLFKLILQTDQLLYILLLSVYGVDAVFTIIIRLGLGENIFQAHRLHLYQLLANEQKLDHRLVSVGYGFVQLLVNLMVIYSIINGSLSLGLKVLLLLAVFYVAIRLVIVRRVKAIKAA